MDLSDIPVCSNSWSVPFPCETFSGVFSLCILLFYCCFLLFNHFNLWCLLQLTTIYMFFCLLVSWKAFGESFVCFHSMYIYLVTISIHSYFYCLVKMLCTVKFSSSFIHCWNTYLRSTRIKHVIHFCFVFSPCTIYSWYFIQNVGLLVSRNCLTKITIQKLNGVLLYVDLIIDPLKIKLKSILFVFVCYTISLKTLKRFYDWFII